MTDGVGVCQRRGGVVEVIRPGDRVFFEPGEEHWHGAAPVWGDHVTDEEYGRVRP
jgi:quercetin dioxygenase-like cupin family protein